MEFMKIQECYSRETYKAIIIIKAESFIFQTYNYHQQIRINIEIFIKTKMIILSKIQNLKEFNDFLKKKKLFVS